MTHPLLFGVRMLYMARWNSFTGWLEDVAAEVLELVKDI